MKTRLGFAWAGALWQMTLFDGALESILPVETFSCPQLETELATRLISWLLDSTPLERIPRDIQAFGIRSVDFAQQTPFQREVYVALRSHAARGGVISYAQLAFKLGRPQAVRAVASALGRNQHALLVPCHRVCKSSGDLGGFAWGSVLKEALLNAEAELFLG